MGKPKIITKSHTQFWVESYEGKSIALRKPEEIEKLFVANQAVAKTLKYLEENVKTLS